MGKYIVVFFRKLCEVLFEASCDVYLLVEERLVFTREISNVFFRLDYMYRKEIFCVGIKFIIYECHLLYKNVIYYTRMLFIIYKCNLLCEYIIRFPLLK